MSGIYLFGLASRQAEWLAQRQAIVAENVANSDTPGFRSKDIASFSDVLETTGLQMAGTDRMHLAAGGGPADQAVATAASERWDVTHSGNTVSLEQEMLKAGEVSRDYALNTSISKAFHRMLLSTLRG